MSPGVGSTEFAVYRGKYLVAKFLARPGNIASALRGAEPAVTDAAVSGEIRAIEEEDTLAEIVRNSASADELIAVLEERGYSIKR